ncbi:hypothetical protein GCM10025867_08540 [Frondihabitans sucicola]|uniref:ASCH domain-containing protein n=1 Tax=Frondihabitans sucicola TaxID=1268041 RepID=A0ABM8GJP8_9MICO|nr:hypothetical protein [Frondihabitans sucicola]BDZ48613.1 hypothetical protein GCM10025867_08540 [Frondihabitans sucicola]
MTAILLSVRPEFANAILSGTKTAEVRRRFPTQVLPTTLYLYSSTPERAVLGTAVLQSIDRPRAVDVWALYRDRIRIGRGPLASYLKDVAQAAILRVEDPIRWHRPLTLAELRSQVGVEPPQSFRYLTDDHLQSIARWGRSSSDARALA